MYVFPGIGLGSILCKAIHISQEMVGLPPFALYAPADPRLDIRLCRCTKHSHQHRRE
jgi:hypothetical protein